MPNAFPHIRRGPVLVLALLGLAGAPAAVRAAQAAPDPPPNTLKAPAEDRPVPGSPVNGAAAPLNPYAPVSSQLNIAPPAPPPQAAPAAADPLAVSPALMNPFGGAGGLFGGQVGQAVPRATYTVLGLPDQPVRGQPTHLGVLRQDLVLGTPIWQCASDEFTFNARIYNELFDTHAVLPGTARPFPSELWDVRLGMTYRHLFDNGWIAGGSLSVGSASDRPFHSINEMTAGVSAFLRVPSGERNAWLFSMSYSPTGQVSFPIPMVAYVWQPSDYLRVNAGLPLQVMYRPTEDLTLVASYMLLTNVHAQALYRVTRQLRLHAGYDWSNQGFFLADRPDVNDRFFSYEQRLSAGVLYALTPRAAVDFSAGYVFGRFYAEGRSGLGGSADRLDVGDGYFLALRLISRW